MKTPIFREVDNNSYAICDHYHKFLFSSLSISLPQIGILTFFHVPRLIMVHVDAHEITIVS